MANPKKKHTPMRRGMRRSANFRLSAPAISFDPKTEEYHIPHRLSPTGYYKGELILPPKEKKKKNKGEK
ncbi:50S ribosomal protein L32 [bacterium F11]|nr:50S ribosomal protein L32 [bacterium F11]